MKDCEHPGEYISPDFKKIRCDVHKSRKKNDHEYVRLSKIDDQLDLLLDQLELKFIDFQTCLAIIDMLLKEKRALKVDYNDLKNFHKDLEDEMNKLNDWFSGGTF
jgi:DNA repair ATPase RecN